MSGPKVVRIVTKEEKIAICETQIARLSSAVNSLLHYLESKEIKDEKMESKLREKLEHYMKLATPNKYREIPAMIQRELDYLSSERDHLKNVALEAARSRQRKIRKLSESIKTLHMLATSSGADIDPNIFLKHSELSNKNNAELSQIEQKISAELSVLAHVREKAHRTRKPGAQHQLIEDRLKSTDDELNISDWRLISAGFDKGDKTSKRLDDVLAELEEMRVPDARKKEYQTKLDAIYEENSAQKRILLLDSVLIDLATESREYKKLQKTRHELSMIKAQVDVLKDETAKRLSLQINKALESEDIVILENMRVAASRELDKLISARSFNEGREAIIDALKSLGYSVSEGMETAVVENGHLVVKKPAEEVYGVEIQAIAAVNKFQLRLVSGVPDNERSTKEDIAEEEKWCEDVAKIRNSLADLDIDLEIEMAQQPGTVAVKHSSVMGKILERERRKTSSNIHKKEL